MCSMRAQFVVVEVDPFGTSIVLRLVPMTFIPCRAFYLNLPQSRQPEQGKFGLFVPGEQHTAHAYDLVVML